MVWKVKKFKVVQKESDVQEKRLPVQTAGDTRRENTLNMLFALAMRSKLTPRALAKKVIAEDKIKAYAEKFVEALGLEMDKQLSKLEKTLNKK